MVGSVRRVAAAIAQQLAEDVQHVEVGAKDRDRRGNGRCCEHEHGADALAVSGSPCTSAVTSGIELCCHMGGQNAQEFNVPDLKALVTGKAGFIGSHLVQAMIGRVDDVAVIENLLTGQFE